MSQEVSFFNEASVLTDSLVQFTSEVIGLEIFFTVSFWLLNQSLY